MRVTSLRLREYRSYPALDIAPWEGINLILGDNAQGKTNAVEAIFLCAFGRSHRTPRDGELIRQGSQFARVEAEISAAGGSHSIHILLRSGEKKRIQLDGKALGRMGELMGILNVVMFAPEDLELIKGGPVQRRRFLDMEICQARPAYFYNLQKYNAALKQRNALLKGDMASPALLEGWDVQLAAYGAAILAERLRSMEKLLPAARELYGGISNSAEDFTIRYAPSFPLEEMREEAPLREALLFRLQAAREEDIRRGSTHPGPHRDDLRLLLNGKDLRIFGSQGQQRTAALALKLSELHILRAETGESPVLILDDVLSELDRNRQRYLLESLGDCQCFLTCTSLDGLQEGRILEKSALWRCAASSLTLAEPGSAPL